MAQREIDEADMNAGRILFFLQERGYPLTLCGEHHMTVNDGSFLPNLLLFFSIIFSCLRN